MSFTTPPWGVEDLRTGAFTPPALVGPVSFAALRAIIGEAQAALAAFDRAEIDGCAGKALDLQIGPRRLSFVAETFILSFSLPNFHFHAVTAYDICARAACPSASATTRAGCGPGRASPPRSGGGTTTATVTRRSPRTSAMHVAPSEARPALS